MPKGITNETRSASQKKFKPNAKINNGLCIGALVDVTISEADITQDSPMTSFQGMKIPRINFVFESMFDKPGVRKAHYIHSYLPMEHTPESLVDGKDGGMWRWNQMSQMTKHFLEVFREYKQFTETELKKLVVDFEDVDENGIFKEQPGDVVAKAYQKFFKGVESLFKPNNKAIYLDEKGVPRPIWMKLLLDINGNLVNRGDYGFPGYPGEGVIELYRKDVEPSLTIKLAKGENIVPRTPAPKATPQSGTTGGGASTNEEVPDFL